jgi:hypothetical protein
MRAQAFHSSAAQAQAKSTAAKCNDATDLDGALPGVCSTRGFVSDRDAEQNAFHIGLPKFVNNEFKQLSINASIAPLLGHDGSKQPSVARLQFEPNSQRSFLK